MKIIYHFSCNKVITYLVSWGLSQEWRHENVHNMEKYWLNSFDLSYHIFYELWLNNDISLTAQLNLVYFDFEMKLTDYLITSIKTVHTIPLIILINSNILLIKTEYFILATHLCQMLSKWIWSHLLICWTHLRLKVISFSVYDISIILYRTGAFMY